MATAPRPSTEASIPLGRPALGLAAACLAAAALAASCSSTPEPMLTGAEAYAPDAEAAYQAALSRWTDQARTYHGFQTVVILKGTLRTPSFQEAWGAEEARRRLAPPPERDTLIDDALREVSDKVLILFAASNPKHTNMGLSKHDSLWNIRLYDDAGQWAEPTSIEAFHQSSRLEPSLLFPYVTRWDDAYLAAFPESPEGSDRRFLGTTNSQVIFQLAGMPGAAELRWEVDGEAARTDRPIPTPYPAPTEPTEAPTLEADPPAPTPAAAP